LSAQFQHSQARQEEAQLLSTQNDPGCGIRTNKKKSVGANPEEEKSGK
jgi:hypothetical protein